MRKLILALAVVVMCGGMTGCDIPTQQMTTRQYIEEDVANKRAASMYRDRNKVFNPYKKFPTYPKTGNSLYRIQLHDI